MRKYKYIHKNGCGKIAFYFDSEPIKNNQIPAELVTFPDGSSPKPHDPFKCGSCGDLFESIILQNVELNV